MANVEHSVLTGSDLHESKGVAAAANNRVFVTNGAGSGSFQQVPAAAIAAAGVLVFQAQLYHIRDERSSGTTGDNLTTGAWNTRTLQTEKTDELTVTTSGNQISLAAGTYWLEAEAVTHFEGSSDNGGTNFVTSKLRIRNVTDSTTLLVGLGQKYRATDDGGGNRQAQNITFTSTICGRFTLAGTKSIELQNWVSTTLNALVIPIVNKGGVAISSGENEVYTDVKIWKIS
jgi:hypothetical protein